MATILLDMLEGQEYEVTDGHDETFIWRGEHLKGKPHGRIVHINKRTGVRSKTMYYLWGMQVTQEKYEEYLNSLR